MSEENTNLVTEELAPAAPVAEPASAPAVKEAPKASKTKAPEPVIEEPAPVEEVAAVAAAPEAIAAPGRGSMGTVAPETGLRIKL